MKCEICGEPLVASGIRKTAVWFWSPEGHNHDDNCVKRDYVCKNGHTITLSKRNRCSNPDCDWVGAETCFCHKGKKVDEWPEV